MAQRTKESALDLAKFVDKSIRVKLAGGREGEPTLRARRAGGDAGPIPAASCLCAARRPPPPPASRRPPLAAIALPAFIRCWSTCLRLAAVVGVLKGYDPLMNLVLDEAVEYLRGVYSPGW